MLPPTVPRTSLVILALGAIATGGCEQLLRIDGGGDCIPPAVQAALDRSCATGGCHDAAGAAGGLVLTASASGSMLTANASGKAMPLVVLGDTAGSYLAHKLMTDPPQPIVGVRMPVGFAGASGPQREDVSTILAWVAGGVFPGCGGAESGTDTSDTDTTTGGDPNGLPCEIEELLAGRCRGCHGATPVGAPMSLVTRDDLLAPSTVDPSVTFADRSLLRMTDPGIPMPPAPATLATAAEIAALSDWIAAGAPEGSCGTVDPDPFALEPRCTSNSYWQGDDGSPQMFPGRDCLDCHADELAEDPDDDDIPDLLIGGTVYPTGHEPNDCRGSNTTDLRVIVRSMMTGDEVTLDPGSAGNFLLYRVDAPAGFAPPYAVKVVDGDAERVMASAAPSGSCNACHTQDGTNGAPGRVVAP